MPKLLQQCIDAAFEADNRLRNSAYVLNTERLKALLTDYLNNYFQAELAGISDLKQLNKFEKDFVEYAQNEAKLNISSRLALIDEKKQTLSLTSSKADTISFQPPEESRSANNTSAPMVQALQSSAKRENANLQNQVASQPTSHLSLSSQNVYLLRSKYIKTYPALAHMLQNVLQNCKISEVIIDPDADIIDAIADLDLSCPPILIFGPIDYKCCRIEESRLKREYGLVAFNIAYLSIDSLKDFEICTIKRYNLESNIQSLFLDQDKPCFNEEQINLLQALCVTERSKFTQQNPVTLDDSLALLKIFKTRLRKKAILNDSLTKLISNMTNEIQVLKGQNISFDRVEAIYNLIVQITRQLKSKEDVRKTDQAIQAFAKEVVYSTASTVARSLGVIALTALGILAAVAAVVGIGMLVGLWLGPMAAMGGFTALFSGSLAQLSIGLGMSFGVAATGLTSALVSKSCLFNNPQQNIAEHAREILKLENPTLMR